MKTGIRFYGQHTTHYMGIEFFNYFIHLRNTFSNNRAAGMKRERDHMISLTTIVAIVTTDSLIHQKPDERTDAKIVKFHRRVPFVIFLHSNRTIPTLRNMDLCMWVICACRCI